MKRSEINALIDDGLAFLARENFHLPRWARWSPAQWKEAGSEADEVRRRQLGWDLTDFGSGRSDRCGLLLFTIRNGEIADPPDPNVKD